MLWENNACEIVDKLQKKEIKPSEVLISLKSRCDKINPNINALPTIVIDEIIEKVINIEKRSAALKGNLFGLPIPIKDSYPVKNVKTTYGSLAYKNYFPERSDFVVQRIEESGGIIYAKSNTPEFEAGASTFNEVFGKTYNPWNQSLSVAGSSGGAAAAVASGMAFIAQGSDFACSLRFPASFCGILGLRTTPGLIPQGPNNMPYQSLSVIGPLARNSEDLGLALDSMVGYNLYDPLTNPFFSDGYRKAACIEFKPKKIAFSEDLKVSHVSQEIRNIFNNAISKLNCDGVDTIEIEPDLKLAHYSFQTLRAHQFSTMWGHVLKNYREKIKPEVVWNIEKGQKLSSEDLTQAEISRMQVRNNIINFLEKYDFLITPTAPVSPNSVDERFVSQIDGIKLENYVEWLSLGYVVSVAGCPAISVPCGFSANGSPVGLQVIGKPYSEKILLGFASYLQSLFKAGLIKPIYRI